MFGCPPCTNFELIYYGFKKIGKHCCITINTPGTVVPKN